MMRINTLYYIYCVRELFNKKFYNMLTYDRYDRQTYNYHYTLNIYDLADFFFVCR